VSLKLSFVGLGHVGLCTAVYFAYRGYNVVAIDIDENKLVLVESGKSPFFEPKLDVMLTEALERGKLKVTSKLSAILDTDMTFITVGTPSAQDGGIDLSYIENAAKEIGYALRRKMDYHLIIVRSTVPPGTTQNLIKRVIEKNSHKKAGEGFGIVMSPEFLKEGTAIHDLENPDRIVIGEFDERSSSIFEKFVRNVYGEKVPILRMSPAEAELAKYASNCFIALKISFINEVANICERMVGTDVTKVAEAIGLDPRIGAKFLRAGAGWGGSCLPKDVRALISFSEKLGYELKLAKAAVLVNDKQATRVVELAEEEVGDLKGKRIAMLGLSFKPNTDDIREAVSLKIIAKLLSKGSMVSVYDPVAMDKVREIFGDKIHYSRSAKSCLKGAECCLIVTEWDEFKRIRPEDFMESMSTPIIVDARRIYDPEVFGRKLKFRAIGLGNQTGE
jgi:UDPglucose 6-dehydrogenase